MALIPCVNPSTSMRLDAIWRYPLKSARGEQLEEAELGPYGVPGDRVAYVVDDRGEILSARTRPGLLELRGGIEDGRATVNGEPFDGPAAARLVREAAGGDAHVQAARSSERFDILPLLVATDGAIAEAGIDARRLRPNLIIGGVRGLAERGWEGRFLRVGEAVIGLATLRDRCIVTTFDPDTLEQDVGVLRDIRGRFGGSLALNAWVARSGTVRVGDEVELLPGVSDFERPLMGRFVARAA